MGLWLFVLTGAMLMFLLLKPARFVLVAQLPKPVVPFASILGEQSEKTEWTLLLTGDVIPARSVNAQATQKNDFSWPFAEIASFLQAADITLINLETPLLTNCPVTQEGMKFCGDARFANNLAESGVDVANTANNHTLNYGWEGLAQTEEYLKSAGIETTGFWSGSDPLEGPTLSKFTMKPVKNVKVGFLGYNAVGQRVDRSTVQNEIGTADKQVDVLIVSIHWGKEYVREPQPDVSLAPDAPVELGKLLIDWGADVVVGNHPHWYQRIEWYSPSNEPGSLKPIFYALGNTVFDQEWSEETKRSYLARLTFTGTTLKAEDIEIIPLGIRNYGEAFLLEDKEKQSVVEFLKNP